MRLSWASACVWLLGCGRINFEPLADATPPLDACPRDPRLQACWDFEGDLDDNSGNGNDAVGSGVVYVAGMFGLALQTTPTSRADLVEPSLDMTQYTTDAWIRPDAATALALAFDHDNHFAFGVDTVDADHVRIFCDTRGNTAYAGTPTPVGQWTRVVCRHDGATITLYVDGVAQGTLSGTTSVDAKPAAIGGNAPAEDFAAPFLGLIDRLRIWNVALTPDELDALTAGRAP
ncbi:MAG: LamG domain-containing protein [Kofleriaceae bacterium]|nr:LamG domain-containing protein [Kofleriaceae bacterium]